MKQLNLLKNMYLKFRLNFFFLFFVIFNLLFFSTLPSFANNLIKIIGNKNVPANTIISMAPKNISLKDSILINEYQKKLFDTGFFKSVEITIKNNELVINVIENYLVNFFFIEGVKNKGILSKIEDFIKIKENTIFQEYLVKTDIVNISKFLNSLGYLNNKVTYKINKLDTDKVNIFYVVDLNKKFKINRVFFIGNKIFKSSKLSNQIQSSEYGWWKFLSSNSTPSEELINHDIFKLKEFYLNNGYFDVQIPSYSINLLNNAAATITYSIEAGDLYYLDNVSFIDKDKYLKNDDKNFLIKNFKKLKNKIYNKESINLISTNFERYFVSKNYDINFSYRLSKNEKNKLNLEFFIEENKSKILVNRITIKGNNLTDEKVIRNFINFSEGDKLNMSKVTKSINQIRGSNLFKKVTYETKEIDNKNFENNIELIVDVEEQPTGEIFAGAGVGTGMGATLSGGIKEKNFLGQGLTVNTALNLGTEKISGNFSYINPDYNNTGNSLIYSLFAENNELKNSGYNNKLIGGKVSLNYEFYEDFYLNPGIAIDIDQVTAEDSANSSIKRLEGDYLTSKIFYNIKKDTRNNKFQPTSGFTFGVGQDLSFLLSDIPYINNRIFGSFYKEYSKGFVGSIKYNLESIDAFDNDIKFSDRLKISESNLRGFQNRGIGPKIDNDFIGGNYMYYTNFSSTIPNGLPEKWNALTNIFFDVANVWGVDYDDTINDSDKIRSSVGLGLSWISPIGPIGMSYAQPLSKASTDDVQEFSIKLGSVF